MAASPSVLREFCPLYYLLNAIPAKVQRGFRSVLVYLTALDSSSDFLAVGSSIGMLYLYCRRPAHMNKYSLEGKSDAITAVKLLSCFDDLVAVGTASGRVAVFQLVSPLPGRNKQLRRFDVVGLHKGSVACLAWSPNGMKLFSGDDKGRVVFSSLDLDQGVCNPLLLLEESSGVVQMEYSHQVLLVSTQHRSLLYCTQTQEVQQLGTKPRRSSGRFGACFLPALCKQSDVQVFAARPGLRLWRADIRGQVEDTRQLKPLFNAQIPQFELFPRAGPMGAYRPEDRQLGLLSCFLQEGWILSWNEYSLYVLDCVNQVVVGALDSSGDIVSVSCCDNEIFVLKGDRDVIRLSTGPEGLSSSSLELSVHQPAPLATPTVLPPTGSVETAQPIRTMAIIVEGGAWERPEEGEQQQEVEEAQEQLEVVALCSDSSSSSRSRSSSVTSWESVRGKASCERSCRRYSAPLGQDGLQQELVVKAVRVKKRRRRQDSSSCSDSLPVVQDGSCSEGGGRASLVGLDLRDQDSPETIQDRISQKAEGEGGTDGEEAESSCEQSGAMLHHGMQILGEASGPGTEPEPGPQTPDVDLLLECTFSYMHNTEEEGQEQQPMEEQQDQLLSPLIGPEEEEDDPVLPAAPPDQMFYSTRSSLSSDEEGDIYCPGPGPAASPAHQETTDPPLDQNPQHRDTRRPDQLAESWMGYSGPGCGILSLQVTDRYVWCLDFKGGLFCSGLLETGLNWQRFEDNVHQVALSPSGNLLWKVEQRSMTAFACAKVSVKGKRHWYKAVEQTAFVALSDDSAWIIRTNGDLYLQTGLSVDRPCARSVKLDSPCVLTQLCVSGGVVWALSEHKAVFYREGLSRYCSEGEGWKYDTVSEAQGLELMCVTVSVCVCHSEAQGLELMCVTVCVCVCHSEAQGLELMCVTVCVCVCHSEAQGLELMCVTVCVCVCHSEAQGLELMCVTVCVCVCHSEAQGLELMCVTVSVCVCHSEAQGLELMCVTVCVCVCHSEAQGLELMCVTVCVCVCHSEAQGLELMCVTVCVCVCHSEAQGLELMCVTVCVCVCHSEAQGLELMCVTVCVCVCHSEAQGLELMCVTVCVCVCHSEAQGLELMCVTVCVCVCHSEAQGLELMCVALAEGGTAWALDASGRLWFRTGICCSRPQGDDDHWWQISMSDYVVFDQGSLFQTLLLATQSVATVTRAPVERVVAFLSQHAQVQPSLVSANSSGVWVASGRNRLHLARGSLVGTFWQNVVPRGTVSATKWSFITSSAVPHREGTFLWLAQSRKDLFCVWDQDGELRPSSILLPVEMELTHLSACRDALWGLDSHGRISIRTLSPSCPCGLHWTPLDLNQLGSVRLVDVSCGCQNVWAVDARGIVYFRVGTQPLNPSMMLPAWIHIEPPVQPIGVQLVRIQTSPNDRLLWALDNRGSVFVRTGLSDEMPVGTEWEQVPGLAVSQLVLSSRSVWVRSLNGGLARRYGVSERNPAGDYWKKIPGDATCLTVTPEDELWAVTLIGGLSRRLTKLLPQSPRWHAPSGSSLSGDDGDDEWELI
ncbi:tectonin beta-propeller repeat-containing protein 2 isoform X1 [Clinocottus analis]|uniref:tectonin beta-propeller repeat-containing protein 2 isoform X1 n=1 Tax=Clinocottus analis TaxID=304258 RepID=UPI0035C19F51